MLQTTMTDFANDFSRVICKLTENKVYSSVLFLCVGTDRITGDAFGPIVGFRLKSLFKNAKNVVIVGDLDNVICDTNIDLCISKIYEKYSNPFIIVIDSALSKFPENVGRVVVQSGGIYLGRGLGKGRNIIGDMCIKGVVAMDLGNFRKNLCLLQNTHLGAVMKMADLVANGIYNSIDCEF